MFGALSRAVHNGLKVNSVIDVGAYEGQWTRAARRVFPKADFLMVEANPNKKPILEGVVRELPGTRYVPMLLGKEPSAGVPYYLLETGSSVLEEVTPFQKELIHLPMDTLDRVCAREPLPGPHFLKLDVQGYELEVLRGAEKTLQNTDAVMAEVSLIEYNRNQPLLDEVVAFLSGRGFVVYDILTMMRRDGDQALFQSDFLFVRRDHALRRYSRFHEDEPESAAS